MQSEWKTSLIIIGITTVLTVVWWGLYPFWGGDVPDVAHARLMGIEIPLSWPISRWSDLALGPVLALMLWNWSKVRREETYIEVGGFDEHGRVLRRGLIIVSGIICGLFYNGEQGGLLFLNVPDIFLILFSGVWGYRYIKAKTQIKTEVMNEYFSTLLGTCFGVWIAGGIAAGIAWIVVWALLAAIILPRKK